MLINWYLELMMEGHAGKLKAKQAKYIGEIHDESVRMVKLVNQLLNISRIETGRINDKQTKT